jgi:hypothetical protein
MVRPIAIKAVSQYIPAQKHTEPGFSRKKNRLQKIFMAKYLRNKE